MTPGRHEEPQALFLQACDLTAEARPAFLDRACGDDADLRARVSALLAYHTDSPTPLPERPLMSAPNPGDARLQVGDLVDGKYRVEALLGAGGMGEVYRARQLALDRLVAIKVLPVDAHPGSGKRFQREATIVARLRHPHVVAVHDLGLAPGVGGYLVMEYVEGRSLRDELRERGKLPERETVALMRQVCAGVAAAHERGVIHRDIKPENILLEGTGDARVAKVADFGIAKLTETAELSFEKLTRTGVLLGTPKYMSPEQWAGTALDARTDVYSLGCMLYELLSGRPPFEAASMQALLVKHLLEAVAVEPLALAGVSAPLVDVVRRAVAKEPEARYASARELASALDTCAADPG